ncbi:MAG: universal stress protein [bacterium]
MFAKILVCYDLSEPSKKALEWSLKIGWDFRSRVKIVHTLTRHDLAFGEDISEQSEALIQKVRSRIDDEVRLLASVGKKAELGGLEMKVLAGHPVVNLLREIEGDSPDLVIIGTHGRTGLFRFLLGSVAEKVLRHSPAPVLAVRQSLGWPPKKVLIPIDFSESSEEALLLATQLRQVGPFQVELFHSVGLPASLLAGNNGISFPLPMTQEAMEKEAREQLGRIIAQHPSLEMSAQVEAGPVAEAICERARQAGTDLILLPTQGRSNVGRLLMGSVAEQVVRYAPCNVLSFCPRKAVPVRREILASLK